MRNFLVVYSIAYLFAIDLVDYAILFFEFSLGTEQYFPHSQNWCTFYQVTLRGNPVLQAWTVVVLLFHTSNVYLLEDVSSSRLSLSSARRRSSSAATPLQCNNQASNPWLLAFLLLALVLGLCLVSIPTAYLATLVSYDGQSAHSYCKIDLIAVTNDELTANKKTALYYLFYQALLSYWLPLLVSVKCSLF